MVEVKKMGETGQRAGHHGSTSVERAEEAMRADFSPIGIAQHVACQDKISVG